MAGQTQQHHHFEIVVVGDHGRLLRHGRVQIPPRCANSAIRPESARENRTVAGHMLPRVACMICVLRVNRVFTTEIPMLLPRLRVRLKIAVPSCAAPR